MALIVLSKFYPPLLNHFLHFIIDPYFCNQKKTNQSFNSFKSKSYADLHNSDKNANNINARAFVRGCVMRMVNAT